VRSSLTEERVVRLADLKHYGVWSVVPPATRKYSRLPRATPAANADGGDTPCSICRGYSSSIAKHIVSHEV
jgi:hypothetical protein